MIVRIIIKRRSVSRVLLMVIQSALSSRVKMEAVFVCKHKAKSDGKGGGGQI